MARIRFVKPEFFTDAKLVKKKVVTRYFYIGLFTQTDREGRFLWNPGDLKIKIIPYDRATAEECLEELLKEGRVIRYGKNGEYGMIVNFLKHQYINPREPDSKIPPPDKSTIPTSYQTKTGTMDEGLRIKELGEREEKARQYLKKIPEKDLEEWYQRFDCSKKALILKGENLYNYCRSRNRIYKDYKHFMLNALMKDFLERKEPPRKAAAAKPTEPEGERRPIPADIKASMKNLVDKIKREKNGE